MERKPEDSSDGFAARLRQARERCRLTQAELSRRAGLDRKSCANIEAGTMVGSLRTVERLALALQVSPEWLAFGGVDAERRVAELRGALSRAKRERLKQAESVQGYWLDGSWEQDHPSLEAEEDEDRDGDGGEAGAGLAVQGPQQRALIAWPHSYRKEATGDCPLPPLGAHYAPVIEALGPGLPARRRIEVGQWMLDMLSMDPEERLVQRRAAVLLWNLLAYLVPARDQAVVRLVICDLASPEPEARVLMALSLILDAGLPTWGQSIERARESFGSGKVRAALTYASRLLYELWFSPSRSSFPSP